VAPGENEVLILLLSLYLIAPLNPSAQAVLHVVESLTLHTATLTLTTNVVVEVPVAPAGMFECHN